MLDSGGKLQFGATTLMNRQEVEGTYTWAIVPPSSIGSTIDKAGLLQAGKNTGRSGAMETVQVIDIVHGSTVGAAAILIKAESGSSAECGLSLSPLSATVLPGQTLQFQAASSGKKCDKGQYVWDISSRIGSAISPEGIYTADRIDDCDTAIDIITVQDTANGLTAHALVTVSTGAESDDKASSTKQGSSPVRKVRLIVGSLLLLCLVALALLGFLLGKKR